MSDTKTAISLTGPANGAIDAPMLANLLSPLFSPSVGVTTGQRRSEIHYLSVTLGVAALLGMLFQIGHFFEHAAQFTIWLLGNLSNICGRDTPWMSPWVTEMVRSGGAWLFPAADPARRMMLGMEVLHLAGNMVFLSAIACLYYCVRSPWVRWAFYIEGFHLYEHVMLTATAFYVGKPIGLSTLFGGANIIGTREFAVGYRVSWHFLMNLLPLPFAMVALMEHLRTRFDDVKIADLPHFCRPN